MVPSHEFEIPVHDLDASGKDFVFPIRAAWLRGELEGTEILAPAKDGVVTLRASRSGRDVVLRGTLRGSLVVPCARCLDLVDVNVSKELTALAVEGDGPVPDEDEVDFATAEADTLTFSGEQVVLDDLIRDELVLEVPMTPLCSEDCPGMHAVPGQSPGLGDVRADSEKPIDPRLRPLLQLMKLIESKTQKKE